MQTIGEKIEETRKRKGISLSEAAEATKIRKDFLHNIENNIYDYDLPEIYKRGFIKYYAKYLKLNSDKVLSQYQEQLIAESNTVKKSNSDFFTSNSDLSNHPDHGSLGPILEKPSLGKINLNKPIESPEEPTSSEETQTNKALYIKTAIIGLCTLLFVFVVFWFIQSVIQSTSSNSEISANANGEYSSSYMPELSKVEQSDEYSISEVTLKASGSVYVQIRQKLDNKMLLSKGLIEGEIQTIKRRGPVDLAFTRGDFITIFTDSETDPFQPDSKSPGKITLP